MLKNKWPKIILISLFLIFLISYFSIPSVNSYTNKLFLLFSFNQESVKEFIRSYGPYAMLISFFLMIFQSIVAPLPAFLITFANAALFGWWQGAILSWSSAMVGAIICFYISRILGRDVAEKLNGKFALESVDNFFEKYGSYTILICRLLPFMSFDIVSYAAGLTSMGIVSFLVATGLGQLPATLIYSYVGSMLTGGSQKFVLGLLILFALSILIFLIKKLMNEKKRGRF